MKFSKEEIETINQKGAKIFGSYDYETEVGKMAAWMEEQKAIGAEIDKFYDSLPHWVSEDDQFSLLMMSEKERAEWLAANNPNIEVKPENVPDHQRPYFQHQLVPSRKPEKVGNIRI